MSDFKFNFGLLFVKGGAAGPGGGALVQSFQQAEIIISPGETFGTITISAVDTANTVLIYGGAVFLDGTGSASTYANAPTILSLDDSTTVRATRFSDIISGQTSVRVTVWDVGTALASSIQHGVIGISAAESTIDYTISAVNTAMSAVILQGHMGGGTTLENTLFKCFLQSSTNVRAVRKINGTTTAQLSFSVIEFQTAYVTSVQGNDINFTNQSVTGVSTLIGAVNTATSVLIWNGHEMGASVPYKNLAYLSLLDATHVLGSHCWTSAGTLTASSTRFTIIDFIASAIKSVQRGIMRHDKVGFTNDVTLTAEVDLSKSICFYGGGGGASSFPYAMYRSVHLADSATVTNTVGISTQTQTTTSYSILEFN